MKKLWLAILAFPTAWLVTASWDFIGKPVVIWMGEGILIAGTSILDSTRDSIYAEVGWRNPQNVSIATSLMVFVIFSLFYLVPPVSIILINALSRDRKQLVEQQKSYLSNRMRDLAHSPKLPILMVGAAIFGVMIMAFGWTRAIYISESRNSLERYAEIIRPVSGDAAYNAAIADINKVANRDDFIAIYTRLKLQAENAGLRPRGDRFIL